MIIQFTAIYIDGLVQERCNSSALAMELRLSCANQSIYAPPDLSDQGRKELIPIYLITISAVSQQQMQQSVFEFV